MEEAVEKLNNIYDEYEKYSKTGWTLPFHEICRTCLSYPYNYNEARKPQNKPFNRYRDVNPYDHSRVELTRGNTDYINANILEVRRARRKYILTQGPLAQTVSHFWLMIWEQKSESIIMLNKIIEKNEIKCHWYWPEDSGEIKRVEFPDVNISVVQLSEDDHNYYNIRKFLMTDLSTGESRQVVHYHYITWPDFGVPSKPGLFLDFLAQVRNDGGMDNTEEHPPVVHCSAGIGRSGTFCLIDSALVIYEHEGADTLNIKDLVLEMRRYRMGLIQTPDQLKFSYETVLEGIRKKKRTSGNAEYDEVTVTKEDSNDDDVPPPPPPRGESLNAPNRLLPPPLPPPPPRGESLNAPSRLLPPPPPPPPAPTNDLPPAPTNDLPPKPAGGSSSSSTSSSDESGANAQVYEGELFESDTELHLEESAVRRRRVRDLAERVTAMRRRARVAESWHTFKRSMYKPLTITCGIILCGIIGYTVISQRN